MSNPGKKKLAILGGGVGALTAAWELSNTPDLREEYEITVYQMGWRLGGKGASGRNAAHNQRIEEHGLHIWMGFYRNAFRVMQSVYDEVRERGIEPYPYKHVSEAFQEQHYIALQEQIDGRWRTWGQTFPINRGQPWEPGAPLPDGRALLMRLVDSSKLWCDQLDRLTGDLHYDMDRADLDFVPRALRDILPDMMPDAVEDIAADMWPDAMGPDTGPIHPGQLLGLARRILGTSGMVWGSTGKSGKLAERVLERLVRTTHRLLRSIEDIGKLGDQARRLWLQADLALTHISGILEDDLLQPGAGRDSASYEDWLENLERIEHLGYREWLRRHNAAERSIDSAFVRGMEGLVFLHRAEGGAGTALNGLARMFFGYSGAIFYKMKGGMGDVVFSPLYDVLRARGVKFEFFHRVERLEVAADGRTVDSIHMRRQVRVRGGGEYHPLVEVGGMRCWPSAPDQAQIVEDISGHDLEAWDCPLSAETLRLRHGRDFDHVVLGISLGALPVVAGELLEKGRPWACRRWRDLTTRVETTATQAAQLWLKDDLAGLGWNLPSPILGSYERPIDTWADMTHLAGYEDWDGHELGHIGYFCGPLDPPDDRLPPAEALARVKDGFLSWSQRNLGPIMPNLIDPEDGSVRWQRLVAPAGAETAEDHWNAQYYRANTQPSDRYVLSVPSSAQYRLRADESGYDNLLIAGDWLRTSLNAGCVEAAVMGGLQAGRALLGENTFEVIGDPERRVPTMPSPEPERPRAQYVERLGEQVIAHPFVMPGTRMYGFLLRCDSGRLQAMCDQHLNQPRTRIDPDGQAQWGYQVLGPLAALLVADMPHMVSTHPGNREKGSIDEIDVAFWVPVVKWELIHGVRVPRKQFWFLPYVFVNRAISVSGGREIMGFFKNHAHIDLSLEGGDLGRMDLSAYAIARFAPEAHARDTLIASIEHRRESSGNRWIDWLEDLGRSVERKLLSALSRSALPLVQSLLGRHVPMVFLKQFRDSERPAEACYQAVIEGHMRLVELREAYLLDEDEYRVTLEHVDSIPLPRILGVDPGPQELLAAWAVHADIAMDTGRAVWSAD